MKKVAAVVVTYNRKELLIQNIDSLLNQSQNDVLDILIIDNASTDGTVYALREYIEKKLLSYFNTGLNLGGAGGFNYGIKIACNRGYDYIWIMDDDTIPKEDALEKLLEANSLIKEYGFLSSNVLWKDNTICLMNRQKYFNTTVIPDNYSEKYIPVTQASFVSLFLTRKVIKKIGLPIKEFFIWGDDVEFTRRISIIHKIPCYMVKNSVVNHYMSTNKGSNIAIDIPERIGRYRFAYRNEFYTYRREGFWGLAYYFCKCIYNISKIICSSKNNKLKRVDVLIKAIIEGAKFNPNIEYL